MSDPNVFALGAQGLKLDSEADIGKHTAPLKENTSVTTINFTGNTLGAPACAALAPLFSAQKNLQTAQLADIFTSRLLSEIPPALDSLLTALLPLEKLETVDLSDNAFGLNTVAPLESFLSQHAPLRHLILNNNGLGPEAGIKVANALSALADRKAEARKQRKGVPDLETVVCGRNRLETGSMAAWTRAFQAHRKGIRVVKMVQNGIRPQGIVTLLSLEGLGGCENLEAVDLQDNTFTSLGVQALAAVLPKWKGLRELGLGDLLLGARGMGVVVDALGQGQNQELRVLRVQYNEIDSRAVGKLVQIVQKGALEGLRRAELNGNKFSEDDEGVEKLREILEERKEEKDEDEDGEWGIDELSDLEEESEEDEDVEEEEEERELKAKKVLEDADQEEAANVSQKKDKDVDDLAERIGKTEMV
ncbi:MAG: hypothetical protein LQ342_004756 [Letrouitia transgressa]|nr:MAG: hypothetical protein LQ342_004756 [Letrouitia transgressa]